MNRCVGQAIRVLDGALAPIACARRNLYHPCADCGDVQSCRVRLLILEARDAIARALDFTTGHRMRAEVVIAVDPGLLPPVESQQATASCC